jgi:hypothetical protein
MSCNKVKLANKRQKRGLSQPIQWYQRKHKSAHILVKGFSSIYVKGMC